MPPAGSKKHSKPVLDMPWTPLQVILGVAGLACTALMVGLVIYYWPELPARIPTHFGASGTPDGWGSKHSLLYLAGVGALLYVVMFVLSRYPHLYNYLTTITESNAETQYRMAMDLMIVLGNVIIWMFTYMTWQTIQTALGQSEGMGAWFLPVFLFLSSGPIVVYLIASLKAKGTPNRK
ncbi:MAG: DUF1648 domain-containing protein [Syntrophomonadales bacterium]